MKHNLKTFPHVHLCDDRFLKWIQDFEAELLKDCKKCGLTVMCTPSMCKFRKTPKEILGESHG